MNYGHCCCQWCLQSLFFLRMLLKAALQVNYYFQLLLKLLSFMKLGKPYLCVIQIFLISSRSDKHNNVTFIVYFNWQLTIDFNWQLLTLIDNLMLSLKYIQGSQNVLYVVLVISVFWVVSVVSCPYQWSHYLILCW